jgi:hypothetical protein
MMRRRGKVANADSTSAAQIAMGRPTKWVDLAQINILGIWDTLSLPARFC